VYELDEKGLKIYATADVPSGATSDVPKKAGWWSWLVALPSPNAI
jgi:hypothetical protein